MIYLDNNSTTRLLPEVAQAMAVCHAAHYANPASQHAEGRRARVALEEAREGIAEILGADVSSHKADQIIFTSGGTEANNLAIRGLVSPAGGHLALSTIEHPSITASADLLQSQGARLEKIPVDTQGQLQFERLAEILDQRPQLVSVMLGNNETGAILPVAEVAAQCRNNGVLIHTDAVAAVGKTPVHFRDLGVDALTCTAHKLHGPLGIGVLVVRHGVALRPLLQGGFQQLGLRPGTEPVTLAVGMHAALKAWQRESSTRQEKMLSLRNLLEERIRAGLPEAVIVHADTTRLPHVSNIAFVGLNRQALAMALDIAGVACSTGSACASGSSEPSPALLAMGLDAGVVESSIRFSLSSLNERSEVIEAADRILRVCNDLRKK